MSQYKIGTNLGTPLLSLRPSIEAVLGGGEMPSPQRAVRVASCGLFGISEDYIEKYQSLDSRFIKNKASTFFFEASGDSMEPLICPKDILIVDRSLEFMDKKVVVFSLDGEMFCKRIIVKRDALLLRSENNSYEDIIVNKEQDFLLFGVVIAIARDIV